MMTEDPTSHWPPDGNDGEAGERTKLDRAPVFRFGSRLVARRGALLNWIKDSEKEGQS